MWTMAQDKCLVYEAILTSVCSTRLIADGTDHTMDKVNLGKSGAAREMYSSYKM